MKKIGIIGGAGPWASCHLYKQIIKTCYQRDDCVTEGDFPEIILINHPFESTQVMSTNKKDQAFVVADLQRCIDVLVASGAQLLAIACNTLHTFLDEMDLRGTELVHIAQETLENAWRQNSCQLLLLGTATTMKKRLYFDERFQLFSPEDEEQSVVDQIIAKILTSSINKLDSQILLDIAKKCYAKNSFDGLVLACTDLPVLHDQFPLCLKIGGNVITTFDSVEILAQALVNKSFC